MNASPTFTLPPCPLCSSVIVLERPYWRFCHNTSATRSSPCYIFTGCLHANKVGKLKVRGDPEEWALVEEDWERQAAAMLAERIAHWSEPAKAGFLRALADRPFMPGAVEQLDLTEPAQVTAAGPDDEEAF